MKFLNESSSTIKVAIGDIIICSWLISTGKLVRLLYVSYPSTANDGMTSSFANRSRHGIRNNSIIQPFRIIVLSIKDDNPRK